MSYGGRPPAGTGCLDLGQGPYVGFNHCSRLGQAFFRCRAWLRIINENSAWLALDIELLNVIYNDLI